MIDPPHAFVDLGAGLEGDPGPPDGEPLEFERNTIMLRLSRDAAIDYGLVEPTAEDLERRAAWLAERRREARTWRGRRLRLRSWWWAHRPVLHLGPCPDRDDG